MSDTDRTSATDSRTVETIDITPEYANIYARFMSLFQHGVANLTKSAKIYESIEPATDLLLSLSMVLNSVQNEVEFYATRDAVNEAVALLAPCRDALNPTVARIENPTMLWHRQRFLEGLVSEVQAQRSVM